MTNRNRLLQIANLWRLVPAYICMKSSPQDIRKLILDEMWHWMKCEQLNERTEFDVFSTLIVKFKEYRSLLQYRIKRGGYSVGP